MASDNTSTGTTDIRRILMGGGPSVSAFPYFSSAGGRPIPMSAQSDWALMTVMEGWSPARSVLYTEEHKLAAARAWVVRHPERLSYEGNKGWALRADVKAARIVADCDKK